ncbi:MAG: sigma 54-interacting transcriptional regulator [candidate division Zixibacteria bacterium]|nr:sigma 54-interacting transcriptional regulator [candidate division Zixibacteria bacterium]
MTKFNAKSMLPDDYAHYCILKTEIGLQLGDYDLLPIINSAIRHYRYSIRTDRYAKAKFLLGRVYVAMGNHAEARECFLESYGSYKRCDDVGGAAASLNRLAFIAGLSGEIDASINLLKQCIDLYQQSNDQEKVKSLTHNLAMVYFISGQLQSALSLFNCTAAHMHNPTADFTYRHKLRCALVMAHVGDIGPAKQLIAETTQLSGDLKREKAQYYEFLGWIHILAGEFNEAEKALLSGLELSLKIAPESALISQTKRLLADAYLGLKRYDLAQKYAEEALIVAEKINERAEIAACWRVFAQTALQRGEKDKAKEWFKKAIDLFAQISSRYELAATRYLAAVSGLYGNGEKAALLYLAKEYFESEDIRPYIEKVNAVLTVTPARPAPRPSGGACPVFVAEHPTTRKIRALAENIAASEMTVLLTGPTGTGKDQLAKYIHFCSGRAGKFVSVNAAAIPEGMVESELFGYRKGAFTGAPQDKPGLFETAEGGTFYLNEIADTTPQFQAKLLEVLETREVRRLGSTQPTKLNIRVIAATNQNLEEAIRSGRFRADLYHRLNEIPISLPPLSERSDDIPALISHFLAEGGFDPTSDGNHDAFKEICSILQTRPWSGNVRELRVEVRRLCLTCSGDISRMLEFLSEGNQTDREKLLKTLQESDWNQREAARRLGLTEGGVRYQMRKYDIGNDSDA